MMARKLFEVEINATSINGDLQGFLPKQSHKQKTLTKRNITLTDARFVVQKIKWFRKITARYNKLDASFLAFVYLAAISPPSREIEVAQERELW